MPEIGATLREARMRARIDVSEIEAQTKIRARYLRALENEEWDLLPGPTFIKSFLRTYATALGLDGKALVEEYRVNYERPAEQDAQPLATHRRRTHSRTGEPGGSPSGPPRGYMVTVGLIALIIVFLVIGLLTRGSSPSKKTRGADRRAPNGQQGAHARSHGRGHAHVGAAPAGLTVSLQPTATVWVCMIDQAQRKLIPGVDLQAGQTSGPFHGQSFEITLGNASVQLTVNGKLMNVPPSTHAIGYTITTAGLAPLAPARQPTCA